MSAPKNALEESQVGPAPAPLPVRRARQAGAAPFKARNIIGQETTSPSEPPLPEPTPIPKPEATIEASAQTPVEPVDEFWGDPVSSPQGEKEKEPEEDTKKAKARKRKPVTRFGAFLLSLPTLRAPVALTLLFVIIPGIALGWYVYNLGLEEGKYQSDLAAAGEGRQLPPEISFALDQALQEVRSGDASSAMRRLRAIERIPVGYPSTTYLLALAAMQDGDIDLAERKAQESISKRERIADSLALQAVLETQKLSDHTRAKLVDPRLRAEMYLRQAIVADAANPYPHFELATLLRYRGARDEALQEVHAAKVRLNPVDSHDIVDVTESIMKLEGVETDKLPLITPDSDDIRQLFPVAYAAMRRGDYSQAATILKKCRRLAAPDLYDYVMNDPALRKFSRQPALTEFFQITH